MSSRSRQVRRVQARGSAAPRRASVTGRRPGRRRWWGWAAAAAVVAVIAGVVLGVHAASGPAATSASGGGGSGSAALPKVGQQAPDGTFTTVSGKTVSVASLRGKPTLLWFVSTWCSSCQAGTSTMAQNVAKLAADGVRVEEVELYQDLGQQGPSITDFGKTLAGASYTSPDWTWGTSSAALTRAYDPASYLDIYYLLNAKGQITYVNSSPAATMPQLLAAAGRLA
jgi:cytochrome oxidase Cu insertion factor (SCO1/SenC/PrrC family)